MKKIVLLLFITIPVLIYSQEKKYTWEEMKILHDDSLKAGVYFSYDQFISNSPDKRYLDLPITEKRGAFVDKDYYLVNGHWLWHIDAQKNEKKLNDKGSELWGWCDGTRLYINKYTSTFHLEFIFLGRFSVFKMKSTGGFMGSTEGSPEYILDLETGETYHLTGKLLEKEILPYTPDLLKEFKDDKIRGYKYLWYLEEFNKAYAEFHKK